MISQSAVLFLPRAMKALRSNAIIQTLHLFWRSFKKMKQNSLSITDATMGYTFPPSNSMTLILSGQILL